MNELLAYTAAALVFAWGVFHAISTRQVVAGFRGISADNQLIITQEWLAEAMVMWLVAALVLVATAIDVEQSTSRWACRMSAVMLVGVGALTAATGARTPFIFFKVCPVLLSSVATLLLIASFL